MLDSGGMWKMRGEYSKKLIEGVVYYSKMDLELPVNYEVKESISSDFIIEKEVKDDFDMQKVLMRDSVAVNKEREKEKEELAKLLKKEVTKVVNANVLMGEAKQGELNQQSSHDNLDLDMNRTGSAFGQRQ